jgi:hypothetical protein
MRKLNAQEEYQISRQWLLPVAILSTANIVLILADGAGRTFFFSLFLPQIAAYHYRYQLSGFGALSVLLATGIAPVVLCFLCWIGSRRSSRWLTVGLILTAADFAALIGYCAVEQRFGAFAVDIAFHLVLLLALARGVKKGRQYELRQAQDQELNDAEALAADALQEPEAPEAPTSDGSSELPEAAAQEKENG